jgi:hypothetical protein
VETAATLEGVQLQNANGESCGGSLANSFAESCNSVFAPLGAKLGAAKLVATAERFGFNRAPDIAGAATSTLPAPDAIGDDLAVGSTAIGQGEVLATPLQMATVAATIGLGGRKPHLTVSIDERTDNTKLKPVVDPSAARTAGRLMLDVVRYGTGTAAAIPGVQVAGKTGTAELQSTQQCTPDPENPESCPDTSDTTDTDAWFAAFAPGGTTRRGVRTPRIAVGVLLVRAGAGGDVAAPLARGGIAAGLKRCQPAGGPPASPSDVDADRALVAVGRGDLHLERTVVERRVRHLEEDELALGRAVRGGLVAVREDVARAERRLRVADEARRLDGEVLVADGVGEREVARGRERLVRRVLHADEHAEPHLVGLQAGLDRRDADEVVLVLDVGGVQLAADLHLVLELADGHVRALGLGRLLRAVVTTRGQAAGDGHGGEDGQGQATELHDGGNLI